LVSDALWELAESLIQPRPLAVNGRTGRPRVDDRLTLEGILFVLETGVPWRKLPAELGFLMPLRSDKRYQWVRVRLAAVDEREMTELVTDAWRIVVPKRVAAEHLGES
jgi:transposase